MLYARTVRYLKARQIAYFLLRRGWQASGTGKSGAFIAERSGLVMVPPITGKMLSIAEDEFCFLNVTKKFSEGNMDWASLEMPKLWRYNLHYFDYILDDARSQGNKSKLVSDWIDKNPLGEGDGWEPYTVSLRIVNWIKLFLQPQFHGNIRFELLQSIFHQAVWLEENIEYHILANHYLKNGKALFFAGMFFEGNDAGKWLNLGLKILREEAQEQILADGGHFERSPMYHAIVVEDYLDVLNLILSSKVQIESALIDLFESKAVAGLTFLHDICMPDGEIPLFNDATFGIAPHPEKLFGYGQLIIGYVRPTYSTGLAICAKNSSGFYVIRNAADMLVVDCGPVGPDYQPGHAHCDTLSYELMLNGRRVVVDSGVHDYESGPNRRYARSTKAHNTVTVDGREQSEVWGVFRVARRAYPLGASLEQVGENRARFEGAHDGYHRLPGKVVHWRTIEYDASEGWVACDVLKGNGTHVMVSFIHLHPDFSAVVKGNSIAVFAADEQIIATIEVEGAAIHLEQSWYFPAFGMRFENVLIALSCEGRLPLQLTYRIRKH